VSWRLDHVTRIISDATIGTAIVLVHVAMADRFAMRQRTDDNHRGSNGLGFRPPDAPRDAARE
jgi:hypothetical protein